MHSARKPYPYQGGRCFQVSNLQFLSPLYPSLSQKVVFCSLYTILKRFRYHFASQECPCARHIEGSYRGLRTIPRMAHLRLNVRDAPERSSYKPPTHLPSTFPHHQPHRHLFLPPSFQLTLLTFSQTMAFKLYFTVVLAMLVACAFSAPARLSTVTRQEGFVFQTTPDTAAATTETETETVTEAPAPAPEPATETPTETAAETTETTTEATTETTTEATTEAITETTTETATETTTETATEVPPMGDAPEASPEDAGESMFSAYDFAYNVGGGAHGDFQADPTEWIVADGDTAAFEIPEAPVVGALTEPLDIYKSHRYGPNAITWGYDIAVENPGIYTCTLHYAETYSEFFTEEPNRTFNVEISGDGSEDVQEASFDVMVELSGAEFTAYRRTFENIAVMNTLSIRETPSLGDAFLSGISCEYVSPIALP